MSSNPHRAHLAVTSVWQLHTDSGWENRTLVYRIRSVLNSVKRHIVDGCRAMVFATGRCRFYLNQIRLNLRL